MSRPIAYNASGPLSGSIRGGNVNYTVDSGNRDYTTFASKKWVPSADGAAPIVFITDTYTQGFELNPNLAVPLFYSCNGTGSAAILYTANRIPNSPGNYSDANVALNDLITARGYFILESNDPYQGINADSLAFDVDASKMSSYPQTGTNWRDLSGKGTNGTLTNGPTWNSNGYFAFDGADDYVNFPNDTALNSNSITVSSTFSPATPTQNGFLFEKGYVNTQYALFFEGSNFKLRFMFNTIGMQDFQVNGPTYFIANRWYNAIVTYDGSVAKMYINGTNVLSTTYNATIQVNNNGERIGAWYDGSNTGYHFAGSIANTQVYPRALTEAQVKQNYFGSPIVTDGLVYAFDANNIVSYPKSGTTWYRLTGSVDCSLINGPTFNSANGGSIVFDGTDDQGNIPANAENILTTVSGEAWVKILGPAQVANYHVVFQKEGGFSGGSVYGIRLQESGGITVMQAMIYYSTVSSDVVVVNGTTNLNDGNWHHVAFTYDSSYNLRVFVDGEQENIGTGTNVPFQNSSNIQVALGDSRRFNGALANFRIYNRALSASEILQNYQAEQYRFAGPQGIPTNGLQLWLDAGNLDSYPGSGTTWYDLSSQGNHMTLVNGPTYNQTNGGVIIFDGIDDYAQRTLSNCSTSFKTMTEYTIVSVFQSLDPTTVWNCLWGFGDGDGNVDNWQQAGTRYFGSDNQYLYTTVDLYTAGINMWAQTFTSGDNKIYRNNTLNTSNAATTITNPSTAAGFVIATNSNGFGYPTKMNMNLMLIYNRVLTTTELTQIYNYYKGRFGL